MAKKTKTPRAPRIEVFPGKDAGYYFRVVAANGETIAQSEGYTRKADAIKAAKRTQKIVAEAVIVEVDAE